MTQCLFNCPFQLWLGGKNLYFTIDKNRGIKFLLFLDQALISENGCVSVEDYLADATEFIHDRQFDNQVPIYLSI